MKKILTILTLALAMMGCKNEDSLFTQQENIVKYLTSSRKMVAEEELSSVIEENPLFYSTFGRYAFRHIVNYYEEGREERNIVEWGDELQIRFNAFTFTGSEPSINANLYWSNIESVIERLESQHNLPLDWSREVLPIKLGTTPVIEGLERSLMGCREQDSVQIYMTSSLAYGKNLIGDVPKNSMVAWYLKIEKIIK